MDYDKNIKNHALFLEYHHNRNNVDIRNKIFEEYMHLAEIISRKYTNKGIEFDDLYQIASIGLLYAIERFDIEKGFEFTSFATPTILGEIKKYFRDKSWTMKMPRRIQELSKKISVAKNELFQKNQIIPTVSELAEYLQVSEEDVLEAMEASRSFNLKSLDINIDNGMENSEVNLFDIVGEEDRQFSQFENKDFVDSIMQKLNPLERQIINKRYITDEKTQVEISMELNVSQVTVSRIEKKVLEKFKLEYEKL
ncbi:MAG: SigB/SigF/SigG family RNA polymerase sigma factor [Dethiosulfatibacter sp.]|nr:SigB/SigF/SigG family RNA polymerase sigma factor [Dethiosulfatibacter sp.]